VGSPACPEAQTTPSRWQPLRKPVALDVEGDWVPQSWRDMDTALAASPLGSDQRIILIGRPGGPEFRPSEVARLGHMAGIVATVLG